MIDFLEKIFIAILSGVIFPIILELWKANRRVKPQIAKTEIVQAKNAPAISKVAVEKKTPPAESSWLVEKIVVPIAVLGFFLGKAVVMSFVATAITSGIIESIFKVGRINLGDLIFNVLMACYTTLFFILIIRQEKEKFNAEPQ